MSQKKKIYSMIVEDSTIRVVRADGYDFLSLTDMAKNNGGDQAIYNWMRNRNTVEFLGIWETIHNPRFKGVEFDTFKKQAGLNSFTLTPRKWIDATDAAGLVSKSGRYGGGTYAHVDIAFEFGTWISPTFKLLLIKEFQRLKANEEKLALWDSRRYLSKINYKLQTAAIKEVILSKLPLPATRHGLVYADEADVLNVVVFGLTAGEWKKQHPDRARAGDNQRDHATIGQLVILANLESLNSMYIAQGKNQPERLLLLRAEADRQRRALLRSETPKQLELKGGADIPPAVAQELK